MSEEIVEVEKEEVTETFVPEEEPKETENNEVKTESAEGTAEKEEDNPFFEYLKNAFAKEHIDSFMNTLTDEQKTFIYVFCSGFETAIGRHIVGVYDTAYIEGFHFTKEILESLKIIIKPVEVEDNKLKFTIVAQLV